MDGCVHSGILSHSLSSVSHELVNDPWAGVTEAGWRREACICTGRESGGRTQVQSDDWVMDGDQVRGDDQVKSASQIVVHDYRVDVPWCVWVTYAPWATWAS